MPSLVDDVVAWYARASRDLPWRNPGTTPWGVLVCEVMSQQTPVTRLAPVWVDWMHRWPTPAALAKEPTSDVLRAWGRLGYPRRALRLVECAQVLVARHAGAVPAGTEELEALPGVGAYTAAAVRAFGFGLRSVVLDTNTRRVLARLLDGLEYAGGLTRAERERADALVPDDPGAAAGWNVALMELGALVCTAKSPRCGQCPVADRCAWLAAGRPPSTPPPAQRFAGTDRQVRGLIMAALRDATSPVPRSDIDLLWPDPEQLARALAGLVGDGLAARTEPESYALPD